MWIYNRRQGISHHFSSNERWYSKIIVIIFFVGAAGLVLGLVVASVAVAVVAAAIDDRCSPAVAAGTVAPME